MIRHVLGIAWHLGGLFVLPFLIAFVAALFFEVSEVTETLPMLLALAALLIVPAFFALVVGVALKVARETRLLRERGRLGTATFIATVHRHVAIVTARGWAVFGTGLLFVVASLGAKWASLGVVAVFSLLLFYAVLGITAFMSTFLVGAFEAGMRRRGSIRRQMSPAVILTGDAAEERFLFERVPVPPGYYLLIEDRLPERLQTVSRYAVGASASRNEGLVVAGRLRRSPRGMYRLGPANVFYQDALGLTRLSVASLATAELKVLPRFRPLQILEPPRSKLEQPDILTRPHRFPTEDFFRFREYAAGDDTRRIHWKLSVRTGALQVRQPETREISTKNVLLVLDSFLPRGRMLDDAVGVEEILDRLVETWISLAKMLVERGDKVTLVAVARDETGKLGTEVVRCDKGGHSRWQDLGARVCWQGQADLGKLLADAETGMNGVVVSSRFQAPPPEPFAGESLTWVWLPPQVALGDHDPTFGEALGGSPGNGLLFFFRAPFAAGADENGLYAQVRLLRSVWGRLGARRRLRALARQNGDRVLKTLIGRGDTVYRLEPGAGRHRLVGVSGGRGAVRSAA